MKITGKIKKHIKIDDLMQNQPSYTMKLNPDTIQLCLMFEEFIEWVGRTVEIHGCYRSSAYNRSISGNAKSNHLQGKAIDFQVNGVDFNEKAPKYMKKWKEITSKHGYVGEAGCYSWGYHFGIQTYSKTFYNWKTDSKGQHNMYYKI